MSDYFRYSYVLVEGGFYIDADDVYHGTPIGHLFVDGRLKLQPFCYDVATAQMVAPSIFTEPGADQPGWIFYFNTTPLIAPRHHPIVESALLNATASLEADSVTGCPKSQATTGPGNLTRSLFEVLSEGCSSEAMMVAHDWELTSTCRWLLSYRNDSRNWRLSESARCTAHSRFREAAMNLARTSLAVLRLAFRLGYGLRRILPKQTSIAFGPRRNSESHTIEKIYVINLDREPDRWSRVRRSFGAYRDGYGNDLLSLTERHTAVDARSFLLDLPKDADVDPFYTLADQLFVEPQPQTLPNTVFELEAPIRMSRAEVAVAKSHIEVWGRVAHGTQAHALILEDDVWIHPSFAPSS